MIVSWKQANYASKTESVKNRTFCSNLNIHHTSGTPKILPKLAKIKNLYIKTVQNVSEPFDVLVKKCKITYYSQSFCFAPHKPTRNVNILKANLGTLFLWYNGFLQGDNYFCWKVSVIKIHKVSMGMNKVQGRPPLSQCSSISLSLFFWKSFRFPSLFFCF